MSAKSILELLSCVEAVGALLVLFMLYRSKELRKYWAFGLLLAHRFVTIAFLLPWTHYGKYWVGIRNAYTIYFYAYWGTYVVDSIILAAAIYMLYRTAMEPLKGLQSLGMLVFKWAAAISTVIALAVSIGPRVNANRFIVSAASQMERASSILTLSLLLFVCFAIRPMGLSYRSRIFAISLGLGVSSAVTMAQASWIARGVSMYGFSDFLISASTLSILAMWTWYFTVPEPKRRFILLPTTSPFLRWNHISELLGHNPGYVAVGGFSPESLAPAELEVMRRASLKMAEKSELQLVSSAA